MAVPITRTVTVMDRLRRSAGVRRVRSRSSSLVSAAPTRRAVSMIARLGARERAAAAASPCASRTRIVESMSAKRSAATRSRSSSRGCWWGLSCVRVRRRTRSWVAESATTRYCEMSAVSPLMRNLLAADRDVLSCSRKSAATSLTWSVWRIEFSRTVTSRMFQRVPAPTSATTSAGPSTTPIRFAPRGAMVAGTAMVLPGGCRAVARYSRTGVCVPSSRVRWNCGSTSRVRTPRVEFTTAYTPVCSTAPSGPLLARIAGGYAFVVLAIHARRGVHTG